MKILYVSNRKDYSGGEICLERLIINANSAKSIVVLPDGPFAKRLMEKGINTIIENRISPLNRIKNRLWYVPLFKYPVVVKKLLNIISTQHIDIIVANGFGCALYVCIAGLLSGRETIWIHHHPLLKPGTIDFRIAPCLSRLFSKVIGVSKAVSKSLMLSGIPKEKVVTIYNGLDFENEFVPYDSHTNVLRNIYGIKENVVLIGMLGAITYWKGFHILLEAIKILKNMGLSERHFVCFFIGESEDFEYKQKLEQDIKKYKLENLVIFTGKKNNVVQIYGDLDVVLNCSVESEPLGTTIYEGMAMEKIVIATDIGGSPEIIDDKVNGFLILPKNPDEIAKLLRMIIENYSTYEDIRKKAREKVIAMFSIQKMVNEYLKVFSDIVYQKKGLAQY